ncbi:MAG: UPF0280 family protein [Candidatus Omnitrophica bacterium]|jgi:hypothetical protein|nr:UPF0280 family protein [Candidatus Omnitrophota bacterium]MDD5079973.1 UPF0280 family protein [Candidatus Omnitrophota bacterium]
MKTEGYKKRYYRGRVNAGDLFKIRVAVKDTDLLILTDKPADKRFIESKIIFYRDKIEEYVNYKDRRFIAALKPIAVESTSHRIIKEMAVQSAKANVGPMASVAGAIAQFLGRDLLAKGFRDVIIENGGDIFMKSTRPVKVGLYAGKNKRLNKINVKIQPERSPLGICTSSATIGHSVSFGNADSAVVIADSAVLADALATAVCNMVKSRDDIGRAIAFGSSIKGVRGIMIILSDTLATWGQVELSR